MGVFGYGAKIEIQILAPYCGVQGSLFLKKVVYMEVHVKGEGQNGIL